MRAMSDNLLDTAAVEAKIEAARLDNEKKTLESEARIRKTLLVPTILMIANVVISLLNLVK